MLSLLAELVRAYSGVSHYIAHYRFPHGAVTQLSDNGDSSVIISSEEVSALSYILDYLLVPKTTSDEATDRYFFLRNFIYGILLLH